MKLETQSVQRWAMFTSQIQYYDQYSGGSILSYWYLSKDFFICTFDMIDDDDDDIWYNYQLISLLWLSTHMLIMVSLCTSLVGWLVNIPEWCWWDTHSYFVSLRTQMSSCVFLLEINEVFIHLSIKVIMNTSAHIDPVIYTRLDWLLRQLHSYFSETSTGWVSLPKQLDSDALQPDPKLIGCQEMVEPWHSLAAATPEDTHCQRTGAMIQAVFLRVIQQLRRLRLLGWPASPPLQSHRGCRTSFCRLPLMMIYVSRASEDLKGPAELMASKERR